MAKLGTYFNLCPVSDITGFLGVSEDKEPGHIIVTFGKNLGIKYRIKDQKQIHSWRTRDKFTSSIIYDHNEEKYFAVFNKVFLRSWTGDEEYLSKLKKHKFPVDIHSLLSCGRQTFVTFTNEAILPLAQALENRKTFEYPKKCVEIDDVLSCCINKVAFVGCTTHENGIFKFKWTSFDENGKELSEDTFELNRNDDCGEVKVVGNVLYEKDGLPYLFLLWSDGKLHSVNITTVTTSLFTIVDNLLTTDSVSLAMLNKEYVAMYGADKNQEGAVLLIYNIQFKVTQCRQLMKLFTRDTKIWCIANSIFLCVGQNLTVVPFRMEMEQLAALVGSRKMIIDPDIEIVTETKVLNWNVSEKSEESLINIPENIRNRVLEYLKQGYTESIICDKLIEEFIEKQNIPAIKSCLDYFHDISESTLVDLLSYLLHADESMFKSVKKLTYKNLPVNFEPLERTELLDKILSLSFNDTILAPILRARLPFNEAVLLLRYICYMLCEDGHLMQDKTAQFSEEMLIKWGIVNLDANYQKFVISRDEKLIELLVYFNKLAKAYLYCLEELNNVEPLITELSRKQRSKKVDNGPTVLYEIEDLKLF